MLREALRYADRGYPVFPLHSVTKKNGVYSCTCGNLDCRSPGKHPRTPNGFRDATTDTKTITEWSPQWPNSNIGIPTGAISGIFVLDDDPRNGGDESLEKLKRLGFDTQRCTTVHDTGGGGLHIFFRYPKEGCRSGKLNKNFPGIDLKGDGGYVVAPPSRHHCGKRYKAKPGKGLGERDLEPVPQLLLDLLNAPSKTNRDSVAPLSQRGTLLERRDDKNTIDRARAYVEKVSPAVSGRGGNEQTYKVACILMIDFWLASDAALEVLKEWNQRCRPRWEETDLVRFLENARRYGKGDPGRLALEIPPEWRVEILVPGSHTLLDDQGNRREREIRTIDFVRDVVSAIPADERYRRGGIPGEIRNGEFVPLTSNRMTLRIDARCALRKLSVKKDENDHLIQIRTFAKTDERLSKLTAAHWQYSRLVRDIKAITNFPLFAGPKFELCHAGWNESTGIYFYETQSDDK